MGTAKTKIIRTSTIGLSMQMFCKDLLCEIKDTYDVLAVSTAGKELDDLSAAGIPTAEISMRRDISPINDLLSLYRLILLCRKERPHIIHSITPKAGLLTMLAAWIARVPIRIHSFTGLLFPTATGVKRQILKTTDRITCACATHILPEGQGVKHDLESAHITSKPLTVLGHGNLRGIDLDHYRRTDAVLSQSKLLRKTYGIKDGEFVFVFIGRIVNDKGISELAQAFSKLVVQHPHAHLLLVGEDGPNGDALTEDTKKALKSTPNVHTAGGWTDDVRPYYAMSQALVFPSYREGFPNVVLEAGAMGLPSIVTDINGSNEIIRQGYNGDIIPAKDTEALYEAMSKYISKPEYVASIAANCRKEIEAKYDAIYVRDCLKKYYETLLKSYKSKAQ